MGLYKDAKRCKSCGAEIYWIKTKAGKDMPVDADSVDPTTQGKPTIFDPTVMTSHFVTCPNADQHRKKG